MDIIEKVIGVLRPTGKRGMAGIWDDEHQLVEAARKARQSGFTKFEAVSPFPLHGIDEAMGLPFSWIPWVTLIFCLAGFAFGIWFTWWTSAVDWPLIIGGKPMWSLAAFIPIIFECTILFGALASVGALLFICGLPQVEPPIIDPSLTSHRFALFFPEDDTGYVAANMEKMLKDLGAAEVKRTEF
jgi:hypothetical protein